MFSCFSKKVVNVKLFYRKRADCKSAGLRLQWFESIPAQIFRKAETNDIRMDENAVRLPARKRQPKRGATAEPNPQSAGRSPGIIHSCPFPPTSDILTCREIRCDSNAENAAGL